MPARSLLQMAQKACIKDIKYLESVGAMPLKIDGAYGAIKPVLWAVERPDQLYLIEQNSPQIIGDDADLWIKLIQRDVDKYADQLPPQPKNPRSWYKLYKRLLQEHQQDIEAQAAQLKATKTGLQDAKQKNQVQSKDKAELPKLPKLEGMQYLRLRDYDMPAYLAKEKRVAERRKEAVNRGTAGSKTKNIFVKLRKERKVASRSVMSTPTHLLHNNLVRNKTAAPSQRPINTQPSQSSRGRNASDVLEQGARLASTSSISSTTSTLETSSTLAGIGERKAVEKPKITKKKAPVDIFIPTKRRRLS